MKPRTFVLTAVAAVATSIAALSVYAASSPWSQVRASGARMTPALTPNAKIGAIVLGAGSAALTLEHKGGKWSIKERAGHPAETEPIRGLLTRLMQAELVEAKTRNPERYALLELEDPTGKDAKSKGLKILDEKGGMIADVVVGKRKVDAFGSNKGGTYVRVGKEAQTWLANADIDVQTEVRRWIKPEILAHDGGKVTRLSLEVPGEPKLEVERKDTKSSFVGFPEDGKKLKDVNAAEMLIRAAANLDADDVRKAPTPAPTEGVTTITFSGDQDVAVTVRLRKDGDANWVTISATGEGGAKAIADAITARNAGWEFKVPSLKAEQLLKKRADLLEGEAKKE